MDCKLRARDPSGLKIACSILPEDGQGDETVDQGSGRCRSPTRMPEGLAVKAVICGPVLVLRWRAMMKEGDGGSVRASVYRRDIAVMIVVVA